MQQDAVFVQRLEMVREPALAPFYAQVLDPDGAAAMAQQLLANEWQEVAMVMFFDFAQQLVGYQVIGRGGLAYSPMEPREILVAALMANAAGIAVVHNHPSGRLNVSDADRAVTKNIQRACQVVGLALLDHFVVTRNGWLSMTKAGLL